VNVNVIVVNSAFFAVFDPSPLTVYNNSIFTYIFAVE